MSEFLLNRAGISNLTSMAQERIMGRGVENAQETAPTAAGQKSFSETLVSMLQDVNEIQKDADSSTKAFAEGKGSLHGVMIAMEKAEISLRALNSVRGKLIEAYQEVLRMPI
jgi:flagellar hook-basal body complex protein FliE